MNNTPFTLDGADEIAEDFEDLIDTSFRTADGMLHEIDNVAVCPFYEEDRLVFMEKYRITGNKTEALAWYQGEEYDVSVITGTSKEGYVCFDIRTFAEQLGIKYNFGL